MSQVSRDFRLAFSFLILAGVLFFFEKIGVVSPVRYGLSIPFEFAQIPTVLIKENLVTRIKFVANLAKLEKENVELSAKLAQLQAENIKLQNLKSENEALRSQLGFFGNEIQAVPAKVVGFSQSLIVLPEDLSKVRVGATVTLGENFIGVVSEVGAKFAKVRLIQDPISSIPAAVLTPQGAIRGNLVGRFGKSQVLEKIEKQEIVSLGASVVTTGEENLLPGLILGQVTAVEPADPSPFLEVQVESLVDYSKITTVFIITE